MVCRFYLVLLAGWLLGGALAMAQPSRVLILGDSMMRVTAHSTERQLGRMDGVESRAFTSLGSGLARLDIFDWMAKIDELVEEFKPEATLVWFGTNDRQALRTDDGVIQPGSDDWATEYGGRIGLAMDKLTALPGSRVLWLELPDMREARMQEDVDMINTIVQAEAEKRPAVTFFLTRPILSRRPGTYAPHVIGPTGMPLQIRDQDGVHLNRAGADRMAEAMTAELFKKGN